MLKKGDLLLKHLVLLRHLCIPRRGPIICPVTFSCHDLNHFMASHFHLQVANRFITAQERAGEKKTYRDRFFIACCNSAFSVSSSATFFWSAPMLTCADTCALTSSELSLCKLPFPTFSERFLLSASSCAMRESRCLQRSAMCT